MKQAYKVPEMGVIEMNIEGVLMALSTGNSLEGTTDGGTASDKDADANAHRGAWGDLWEDM